MLNIKYLATFCALSVFFSSAAIATPLTCDEAPFGGMFGTCREMLQKSVDTIHDFEARIELLEEKKAQVCSAKSNKQNKKCRAVKQKIRSLEGIQAFIVNSLPNQLELCDCPEVTDTL